MFYENSALQRFPLDQWFYPFNSTSEKHIRLIKHISTFVCAVMQSIQNLSNGSTSHLWHHSSILQVFCSVLCRILVDHQSSKMTISIQYYVFPSISLCVSLIVNLEVEYHDLSNEFFSRSSDHLLCQTSIFSSMTLTVH